MTAPLRPANAPDPDEPPVYVQPVDDTGTPLVRQPRLADPGLTRLELRKRLREAREAAGLTRRDVAVPLPWSGAALDVCAFCARSGLAVVVQFKSLWEAASPAGLRDSPDHRLLPSTGAARDTSALALWT